MRIARARWLWSTLVVAMGMLACSQAAPSSSPGSTGSPNLPPSSGSGTPPAVQTTQPSPSTELPTSFGLITAALQGGKLDYTTALLYRMYASVGDERLPEAYRGKWSEDPLAVDLARRNYATFSADIQQQMLPFIVRPTSPDSYWAAAPQAIALTGPAELGAAACVDGFLSEQARAPVAVKVWGQCGQRSAADVAAEVAEAVFDIEQLWAPMTTLMGTPLGDQNDPSLQVPASPEGGDGLLDIYLVDPDTRPNFYGRDLSNDATGVAYEWWPKIGNAGAAATSTYIVINNAVTGLQLRSVIAHEFFHSQQARFNRTGTVIQIATADGEVDWAHFWFVEASAKWSEHEFVPEANDLGSGTYNWFSGNFQSSAQSLMESDHWNEYASWPWPLFMRQQLGAQAIADAWTEFQGEAGHRKLQAALDLVLPFKQNFREFAVRVLDVDMQPGDPLKPRFQVLDASFPQTLPTGPRMSPDNTITVGGNLDFQHQLPSLWSRYVRLLAARDVNQLEFDFSALSAAATIDVELIFKPRSQSWQRRSVGAADAKLNLCDVSEAWVVAANHDQTLNATAPSTWSVKGLAEPCPKQATADITDTYTTTWTESDGSLTTDHGELTVHLVIAFTETGAMYAARGSTFHLVRRGTGLTTCPSDEQSGSLGLPSGWLPQPLADPDAIGTAHIGGGGADGGGEIGVEVSIPVGCVAWVGNYRFVEAQDGVWHHDEVQPKTQLGPYQTVEYESHGTITGL